MGIPKKLEKRYLIKCERHFYYNGITEIDKLYVSNSFRFIKGEPYLKLLESHHWPCIRKYKKKSSAMKRIEYLKSILGTRKCWGLKYGYIIVFEVEEKEVKVE